MCRVLVCCCCCWFIFPTFGHGCWLVLRQFLEFVICTSRDRLLSFLTDWEAIFYGIYRTENSIKRDVAFSIPVFKNSREVRTSVLREWFTFQRMCMKLMPFSLSYQIYSLKNPTHVYFSNHILLILIERGEKLKRAMTVSHSCRKFTAHRATDGRTEGVTFSFITITRSLCMHNLTKRYFCDVFPFWNLIDLHKTRFPCNLHTFAMQFSRKKATDIQLHSLHYFPLLLIYN